jgi:hypothetical protein
VCFFNDLRNQFDDPNLQKEKFLNKFWSYKIKKIVRYYVKKGFFVFQFVVTKLYGGIEVQPIKAMPIAI